MPSPNSLVLRYATSSWASCLRSSGTAMAYLLAAAGDLTEQVSVSHTRPEPSSNACSVCPGHAWGSDGGVPGAGMLIDVVPAPPADRAGGQPNSRWANSVPLHFNSWGMVSRAVPDRFRSCYQRRDPWTRPGGLP